ncbi:hypothetical protein Scep_023356 [Stephania cephalantha]|uniref:FBD domain-containing protein n=1 Tax=Stephania cephalantha TaxID=152367 RepID=A0AAP0EVF7_9MAGN
MLLLLLFACTLNPINSKEFFRDLSNRGFLIFHPQSSRIARCLLITWKSLQMTHLDTSNRPNLCISRCVKIHGAIGSENEFRLMDFVYKNAMVLENVVYGGVTSKKIKIRPFRVLLVFCPLGMAA